MSLSAFYIEEAELPKVSSGIYSDQTSGKSPVQAMMHLGIEERKLNGEIDVLGSLRNDAINGITGALDKIVAKFGSKEPTIFEVKLEKDMIEHGQLKLDGQTYEKFGAKEIERDAQMETLARNVERARKYLPDVELHEIQSADGKRVAIVTGADAKTFNAVIAAENEWDKLQQKHTLLKEEKTALNKKMDLNIGTEISGGKDTKPGTVAFSPAAETSKITEIT